MRRREFIGLLSGVAVAWPFTARAQQPDRAPRIGVLLGLPENDADAKVWVSVFQRELKKLGWIDDQNVKIEYRWDDGNIRNIRRNAAEIVELAPAVILSRGSTTLAALRMDTRTIPIVFVAVSDPVAQGIVSSLSHPGGNITGFTNHEAIMYAKLVELLRQIVPKLARLVVVHDPDHPLAPVYYPAINAAARSFDVEPIQASVRNAIEIQHAIDSFAGELNGGMIVMADNVTNIHRKLIIELAAQHHLPAIYQSRYFITAGGLVSYGADVADLFKRSASYVDLILRGTNPADLPVQAPTRFELIVNLKTTKALGLTIPQSLFITADEVIE
jgi:putative ABC transport system substrate-binding protein